MEDEEYREYGEYKGSVEWPRFLVFLESLVFQSRQKLIQQPDGWMPAPTALKSRRHLLRRLRFAIKPVNPSTHRWDTAVHTFLSAMLMEPSWNRLAAAARASYGTRRPR
jgi:hypothetical protein